MQDCQKYRLEHMHRQGSHAHDEEVIMQASRLSTFFIQSDEEKDFFLKFETKKQLIKLSKYAFRLQQTKIKIFQGDYYSCCSF